MNCRTARAQSSARALFLGLGLIACSPENTPQTGGSDSEEVIGVSGRSCGRGVAVLMTDYVSSNVALMDLEGQTVSSSFFSSGSASPQLNAVLGGDAVLPSSGMWGVIAVIDRFPSSVLTILDVETAEVLNQVSVRTGFDANPQDLLFLDTTRALVSRFEKNSRPGQESFDEGDDLLLIDFSESRIVKRIDFSGILEEGERARPSTIARSGDLILVSLLGLNDTFSDAAPARIAVLDATTLEIVGHTTLPDYKNCSEMALSPTGQQVALACGGLLGAAAGDAPEFSGVLVLSLDPLAEKGSQEFLAEQRSWSSGELQLGPPGFALEFARDDRLISGFYGAIEGDDAPRPDRLMQFDLRTGEHTEILASSDEAFTLGDVVCAEACSVCFAADAGRSTLHRFSVSAEGLSKEGQHQVDSSLALPPRILARF